STTGWTAAVLTTGSASRCGQALSGVAPADDVCPGRSGSGLHHQLQALVLRPGLVGVRHVDGGVGDRAGPFAGATADALGDVDPRLLEDDLVAVAVELGDLDGPDGLRGGRAELLA